MGVMALARVFRLSGKPLLKVQIRQGILNQVAAARVKRGQGPETENIEKDIIMFALRDPVIPRGGQGAD